MFALFCYCLVYCSYFVVLFLCMRVGLDDQQFEGAEDQVGEDFEHQQDFVEGKCN